MPAGVVLSNDRSDFGAPLGFVVLAPAPEIYWTDDRMDSTLKGLKRALGVTSHDLDWVDSGAGLTAHLPVVTGADALISAWSDDRSVAIVDKSGPNEPDEYYLLVDGTKLTLLGRSRPWIDRRRPWATAGLSNIRRATD